MRNSEEPSQSLSGLHSEASKTKNKQRDQIIFKSDSATAAAAADGEDSKASPAADSAAPSRNSKHVIDGCGFAHNSTTSNFVNLIPSFTDPNNNEAKEDDDDEDDDDYGDAVDTTANNRDDDDDDGKSNSSDIGEEHLPFPSNNPWPWYRSVLMCGVLAGVGVSGYLAYKALCRPPTLPADYCSGGLTWVPTTWSKFVELLKMRSVKQLVFRDDAVFITDAEGKSFVTGLVPGSSNWLFEYIKEVPLVLSIPFASKLAFLPFRWSLLNQQQDNSAALSGAASVPATPPATITDGAPVLSAAPATIDVPNFNELEAQMLISHSSDSNSIMNSNRSNFMGLPAGILDSLWSSLILLALTGVCMSIDWNSSGPFFRRLLPMSDKKNRERRKRVTFAEVAGHSDTKKELLQLVEFLKHPSRFVAIGARMPRGILLEGRSGTGKTLLAKAVAGEAGVPFLYVSGSSFVELYVGQGAARVRQVFRQARKDAPCVVFIDELDALGTSRSSLGSSNQEYIQTLNQVLTEMDGLEEICESGGNMVVVMGATNRFDSLDEALTRPGRFDRVISLNLPNLEEREKICQIHSRSKKLHCSVKLNTLAAITAGWTGAEIECLLNEAALMAARSGSSTILNIHLAKVVVQIHKRRSRESEADQQRRRAMAAAAAVGFPHLAEFFPSVAAKPSNIDENRE